MSDTVEIAGRLIGKGHPVFVICEMSANHLGSFDDAARIVRAAKDAGADAIKLQTYTPDTITIDADNEHFRIGQGTLWDGKTFHNLYKEAYTPWDWQPKLKAIADELGLICFSSPFDNTAVDFLERMDVPAYKIASFEITDIPLIEYVASKGKPVIISTGIATLGDIDEAVSACLRMGNARIILLKCTSAYPAKASEMNLSVIPNLAGTFNLPVGLSDHTLGITISVAAVSLGACVIEKHMTLDRGQGGPDAAFSLEPGEFGQMVRAVREAEESLGTGEYIVTERMRKSRDFSRSLFIVRDMKSGEVFTSENVRSIRPGYGMHPRHLNAILGKRVRADAVKGTPLQWGLIG